MASNPTSVILASVVTMVGITEISDIHGKGTKGQPGYQASGFHMQPVITGFILGTGLLVVGIFAPTVAKAFAYLGVVGALATNGPNALAAVGKIT